MNVNEFKHRYNEYMQSADWKEIRKRVFERDGHRCTDCGHDRSLTVHHKHYDNFQNESLDDLVTLCRYCHGILFHTTKINALVLEREMLLSGRQYIPGGPRGRPPVESEKAREFVLSVLIDDAELSMKSLVDMTSDICNRRTLTRVLKQMTDAGHVEWWMSGRLKMYRKRANV